METFLLKLNIYSQEGEMISTFSEILTWSYKVEDIKQLILDNLDIKVDPDSMIFKFKSKGVALSHNKTFEIYRDIMESKLTNCTELGEEDDGEEWMAYIVNTYLCFRDFDSSEFSESRSRSKGVNSNSKTGKSIPSPN